LFRSTCSSWNTWWYRSTNSNAIFLIFSWSKLMYICSHHWYLIIVKSPGLSIANSGQKRCDIHWYYINMLKQIFLSSKLFVLDSAYSDLPRSVIDDVKSYLQLEAKHRWNKTLNKDKFDSFLVSVSVRICWLIWLTEVLTGPPAKECHRLWHLYSTSHEDVSEQSGFFCWPYGGTYLCSALTW
jgi:hypothetical protein